MVKAMIRKGNIVASESFLSEMPSQSDKISSFDNRKGKRIDAFYNYAKQNGYTVESVFDAVHGRRYLAFVYRDRSERAACWNVLTGPCS